MVLRVRLKKLSRSSLVKSLSKKFRKPTYRFGSGMSSSGSRLMLWGWKFCLENAVVGDGGGKAYLQRSCIFCMVSTSSREFLVFWSLVRWVWTWAHQGRSQGSITSAILEI